MRVGCREAVGTILALHGKGGADMRRGDANLLGWALRGVFRYAVRGISVVVRLLLILLLLYGFAVVAGALFRAPDSQADAEPVPYAESVVYLVNNGYHVEFCLPIAHAPEWFPRAVEASFSARFGKSVPAWAHYYCIGWGDRIFYPETPYLADMRVGSALRSLFLPTRAAVRISFYPDLSLQNDARFTAVPVSPAQVDTLYGFVAERSLIGDPDGSGVDGEGAAAGSQPLPEFRLLPESVPDPAYGESLFVEASGWYSLLFTCNNWTSSALRAAGIPTGLWTPLPWGVGR